MKRLTLIITAAVLLCAGSATAQASVVHCPNSQTSDHILVSNESARNVSCGTVHSLMSQAWLWRWQELVWGKNANDMPVAYSPRGWNCRQLLIYFSTSNPNRQDDGTSTGSVTRCTAPGKALRVTEGRVTPWSQGR